MSKASDETPAWHEVAVVLDASCASDVEEYLLNAGALAVTIVPLGEDVLALTEPPDPETLVGECRLTGLFAEPCDVVPIADVLKAQFALEPQHRSFADEQWAETWRDQFAPIDFGHGLFVGPPWSEPPSAAREYIAIEPGMAFGTGTHQTTSLCLRWLAAYPALDEKRVLDYGCGSGVLAIAAEKCGANDVLGIDIDPVAVRLARAAATANSCHRTLFAQSLDDSDASLGAPFDIIIANILAGPLVELAPLLRSQAAPGCEILLSGVLQPQCAAVLAAYSAGFKMSEPVFDGDWARLYGVLKN